jgi:hypothetical protein
MRWTRRYLAQGRGVLILVALALTGCVGTTGGDEFSFQAFARGPEGVSAPYDFVNGKGYRVSLERARVHVGAAYLNRSAPTSVSASTSCTLAGIYSAEVAGALDVDALSDVPQPFPVAGRATSDRARTGEVWLTGRDVNDPADSTVILDVAGTASREGESRAFAGQLTIGENRVQPTPSAEPGLKPICKERIVSPIPVDVTPARGGRLTLAIEPAKMFANVDFFELAADAGGTLEFDDDPATATPASTNLYIGLRASSGVYSFSFDP